MKIWKYTLPTITTEQNISLPKGASILNAKAVNGNIVIWVIFDGNVPPEYRLRKIGIFLTGQPIPTDGVRFVDTVVISEYDVYHVFEML